MGLTLQALAFRFNFYFFFNKILFLISLIYTLITGGYCVG